MCLLEFGQVCWGNWSKFEKYLSLLNLKEEMFGFVVRREERCCGAVPVYYATVRRNGAGNGGGACRPGRGKDPLKMRVVM